MRFNSQNIINEKLSSEGLRVYIVGFDLGKYRNDELTELIMNTLVDFAFGYHTGILTTYDRPILKEAARALYKIKEFNKVKEIYLDDDSELSDCEIKEEEKYLKRGEFGEMILHLILRDFFETEPLLSKIHFKDTDGATVHGFDVVHIGKDLIDDTKNSIFLGESKLYSRKAGDAGRHGISDLIDDIKSHFHCEFLRREIALINKKKDSFKSLDSYEDQNTRQAYAEFLERKKEWFSTFEKIQSGEQKLQDFFKSVTIPLICTYQSPIFEGCTDETDTAFGTALETEAECLKQFLDEKLAAIQSDVGEPKASDLNIILILFPIPSKKDLVRLLHEKLNKEQG